MCVSPAAARSSASDTLSCVRADFVLLCVHAVLDSCADAQRAQLFAAYKRSLPRLHTTYAVHVYAIEELAMTETDLCAPG